MLWLWKTVLLFVTVVEKDHTCQVELKRILLRSKGSSEDSRIFCFHYKLLVNFISYCNRHIFRAESSYKIGICGGGIFISNSSKDWLLATLGKFTETLCFYCTVITHFKAHHFKATFLKNPENLSSSKSPF